MKMNKRMALGLLGAGAVCAAAVAVNARVAKSTSAPISTVRYEWRNGTVAPPYHYEYSILLGPGARGQMLLRPGYPTNDSKQVEWKESFAFTPQARQKLHATMRAHGVFTRSWSSATGSNRPVGGGSESLQAKAGWRTFSIPGYLPSEADQVEAQAVYAAINALVPGAARARIEARRKKYEQQALKATG